MKFLNYQYFIPVVTGLYVAIFQISNNFTMLNGRSVLVVLAVLWAPPIVLSVIWRIVATVLKLQDFFKAGLVFLSVLYALIMLRHSIYGVPVISDFLERAGGLNSSGAKLAYLVSVICATSIITYFARRETRVLAAMISAMLLVAVTVNSPAFFTEYSKSDVDFASNEIFSDRSVKLVATPDIYLILADGYGSLSYMREKQVQVSDFTDYLDRTRFKVYPDVYSNYHPTLFAMAAILNMNHHFYDQSNNHGEIPRSGRLAIAGDNQLIYLLKDRGYQAHYLHQGPYLLLHGCGKMVDSCNPSDPIAGARALVNFVTPGVLRPIIQGLLRMINAWDDNKTLIQLGQEIRSLVAQNNNGQPDFTYLHVYAPSHVPNTVEGICDETEELAAYGERAGIANKFLQNTISSIVSSDPEAVIILAGDHGPFINQQCSRDAYISSPSEYRDRLGVLLAIRWPDSYDGRYDNQLKTTINLFRLVLASLTVEDSALLASYAAQDSYARYSDGYLRIMQNGELLFPPEFLTTKEMAKKKLEQQLGENPVD